MNKLTCLAEFAAVLAALVPRNAEALSSCTGTDWLYHRGHCYKLFFKQANRQAAHIKCTSTKAWIASAKNRAENAFLVTMRPNLERVFLGGNDIGQEGDWRWDDGTSVVWTNWGSAGQNHTNGRSDGNEDCLEMTDNGTWNILPCNHSRAYICKSKDYKMLLENCSNASPPVFNLESGFGELTCSSVPPANFTATLTLAYGGGQINTFTHDTPGTVNKTDDSMPQKGFTTISCRHTNHACQSRGNEIVVSPDPKTNSFKIKFSLRGTTSGVLRCKDDAAEYDAGETCRYHVTKAPSLVTCNLQTNPTVTMRCEASGFVHTLDTANLTCAWKEDGPDGLQTVPSTLLQYDASSSPWKGNCSAQRPQRFMADGGYMYWMTLLPWGRRTFVGQVRDVNVVDSCLSVPCYNGGTCYDLVGNFTCACHVPFIGQQCEQVPAFIPEHECPTIVAEFDDVVCICHSSVDVRGAQPPIVLSWDSGPHYSSVSDITLELFNVSRGQSGSVYWCRQTWSHDGSNKTINYTLNVTYGPSHVWISGPVQFVTDGDDPLPLTCHTDDLNPTPPVYTWRDVVCENGNRGPTCWWTPNVFLDRGRVVTCEASNSILNTSRGAGQYSLRMQWTGKPAVKDLTFNTSNGNAGSVVILYPGVSAVALSCEAGGEPTPTITLTQKGALRPLQVLSTVTRVHELQEVVVKRYLVVGAENALRCEPEAPNCNVRTYTCSASNRKGFAEKTVDLVIGGCLCTSAVKADTLSVTFRKTDVPIIVGAVVGFVVLLMLMAVQRELRKTLHMKMSMPGGMRHHQETTCSDKFLDFLMERVSQEIIYRMLGVKTLDPGKAEEMSYHSSEDSELQYIRSVNATLSKEVRRASAVADVLLDDLKEDKARVALREDTPLDVSDSAPASVTASKASDVSATIDVDIGIPIAAESFLVSYEQEKRMSGGDTESQTSTRLLYGQFRCTSEVASQRE